MNRRFRFMAIMVGLLVAIAVIASSCTSCSDESDKKDAQSQVIPIKVKKLYVANIRIGCISDTSTVINDTLNMQYYCRAFDKYDADRTFNDSVAVIKSQQVIDYTISECTVIGMPK